MYIIGAESSVPAYVTTDGLDDPPGLFYSGSWATVVRRSTVVSITAPMFSPRRNTEKECIVHNIQHTLQAHCYVEMKLSFLFSFEH